MRHAGQTPVEADFVVEGIGLLGTPRGVAALSGADASRLHLVRDAAVASFDGRIVFAGAARDLPGAVRALPDVRRFHAGGAALVPGFVDPHTHAVFAGDRSDEFRERLGGRSYADIAAAGGGILATVTPTRAASEDELCESLRPRLDAMLRCGVTTVEIKSGYGLEAGAELRQLRAARRAGEGHPIDVLATFMGAHAIPLELRADRAAYVNSVCDVMLPLVAAEGLALACDVFCDQGAFEREEARRILERARSLGLALKIHADELVAAGGAELAAELGAVSAEHLLRSSDAGIEAMARAGVIAVLLPATSFFLRESPALGARFRDRGCAMAVATDFNPGSSPAASMPAVAVLACVQNQLTPEETLTAMTLNAAAASGCAADRGSLEPGKLFDAVVLRGRDPLALVYEHAFAPVRDVIKRGRIVVEDGCIVR